VQKLTRVSHWSSNDKNEHESARKELELEFHGCEDVDASNSDEDTWLMGFGNMEELRLQQQQRYQVFSSCTSL